ncbi:MAG: hypothetical protein JO250_09500 [Armatimonadetes bacterium]|nr:hypothetical protein [Armatimonadota bacterium]
MSDAERRAEIDETLAARLAHVRQREHVRGLRRREWVVLAFFLILAASTSVNFKRVVVTGRSMEPTFHNGEAVLVWKFAPRDKLKPGDVIVFRRGRDELIKRILYIADPRQAGIFPPPGFPRTLTNPEGWYIPPNASPNMTFALYFFKVQYGLKPTPALNQTIYVLGDNLPFSSDSRDFGPISPDQILGKVMP